MGIRAGGRSTKRSPEEKDMVSMKAITGGGRIMRRNLEERDMVTRRAITAGGKSMRRSQDARDMVLRNMSRSPAERDTVTSNTGGRRKLTMDVV